jgi:hypothetical protein
MVWHKRWAGTICRAGGALMGNRRQPGGVGWVAGGAEWMGVTQQHMHPWA